MAETIKSVNIDLPNKLAKRIKNPLKKNNLVFIPKINTNQLELDKEE